LNNTRVTDLTKEVCYISSPLSPFSRAKGDMTYSGQSDSPKPKISQRTISAMIVHYDYLFHDTGPRGSWSPLLNIDQLRNVLYAMEFDREFLDRCDYEFHWSFRDILPALNDGSFFCKNGATPSWAKDAGQRALQDFAATLCALLEKRPDFRRSDTDFYFQFLLDDGFQFVGTRLIETNQDIVPEAEEISAVEALIRASLHDERETLLAHFHAGVTQFDSGSYHSSVAEWRCFLEEVLRGIWRLTRARRTEFSNYADHPTLKDLFTFLERSNFLNKDEQLAFSSAWGFLSAGGHPGITAKDDAHLSKMLALTFGHAALLKLQVWASNSYRHF
jgi:hypothetical protein